MRVERLSIEVGGRGLHEITRAVAGIVKAAGVAEGLCTVFVQHTSASLVIQENADPSAARDLDAFLERLVPEGDSLYTHTAEARMTCRRMCVLRSPRRHSRFQWCKVVSALEPGRACSCGSIEGMPAFAMYWFT